jgi:hypothetical protein
VTDTPVTKLDSVERLTEKYAIGWHPDCVRDFRAALADMWDLSRREALREAAGVVGEWQSSDPMAALKAEHIVADLERLAVEEGKNHAK